MQIYYLTEAGSHKAYINSFMNLYHKWTVFKRGIYPTDKKKINNNCYLSGSE